MKRQAQGMTIIELMTAIAVGALLTLGLYRSFDATKRTTTSVDRLLYYAHQEPLLYNLLKQDISGMFATPAQPPTDQKKTEKKEEKTPDCIYKQDENLQKLSFLTTHALQQYDSCTAPCVRVAYTLKQQENTEPKQYSLIRTEQPLPEKQYAERAKTYTVASGIIKLQAELFYPEPQDQSKPAPPKTTYQKTKDWPLAKPEKSDKKTPPPPLPAYITFNMALYNPISKKPEQHTYQVNVPGFVIPKKQEPQKPVTPNKKMPQRKR